ncbi:hypothetical protein JDV02_010493 [Purpureocillium takamizusanense]|uniref:Uncharacterized protein n=1 Tax=Purpureocillium takamizusanense TaxID=2060973 RepID=A0A9Q8VHB6_9HYPO|nr:uncharacterized protein JDV02_010493 [Purpureocillium takamizusanense]UNI24769.1 hypothetical protein JDV02_010493 [Purpureocillium takamizusanense]
MKLSVLPLLCVASLAAQGTDRYIPTKFPPKSLVERTEHGPLRPWRNPAPSRRDNPEEHARLCKGPDPKEERSFRKSEQCVGTREWCRKEYYLESSLPNEVWEWFLRPHLCMQSREPEPKA